MPTPVYEGNNAPFEGLCNTKKHVLTIFALLAGFQL